MVPSLSRLLAAFPNLQISILCRKIRNEGSRAGILEYLEVAAPAMHACPRRLTEAADLLKQTSHVTRVPRAVDDGFILKVVATPSRWPCGTVGSLRHSPASRGTAGHHW